MGESMKILFSFCALALVLTACGKNDDKKSSDTANQVQVVNGSAVRGRVTIGSDCGTTTATVRISGTYATTPVNQVSVPNGGQFNFQISSGNYVVAVQAGNCYLSATVPAGMDESTRANICVSNSSTCNGATTTTGTVTGPYTGTDILLNGNFTSSYDYMGANYSGTSCMWSGWGCSGYSYPGTGWGVMGKPNVYVTVKEDTEFSIDLKYEKGNNPLASVPAMEGKPWKLKAQKDGKVVVDGVPHDFLFYDAQIDEKSLQMTESFCVKRSEAIAKMSDYLTQSGFSQRATKDFEEQWKTSLPPNESFCIYPQAEGDISKMVSLKPTLPANVLRVWFFMVPQVEAALLKVKPYPKRLQAFMELKGNNNAFAAFKKAEHNNRRQVANDASVTIEEWGVGFPLDR